MWPESWNSLVPSFLGLPMPANHSAPRRRIVGTTAMVVLSPAADLDPAMAGDELKAWCRQRLAGYKCPRGISFTEALPLSAAGKVLKTALRAAHPK